MPCALLTFRTGFCVNPPILPGQDDHRSTRVNSEAQRIVVKTKNPFQTPFPELSDSRPAVVTSVTPDHQSP